jgi:hypothetical protein
MLVGDNVSLAIDYEPRALPERDRDLMRTITLRKNPDRYHARVNSFIESGEVTTGD